MQTQAEQQRLMGLLLVVEWAVEMKPEKPIQIFKPRIDAYLDEIDWVRNVKMDLGLCMDKNSFYPTIWGWIEGSY